MQKQSISVCNVTKILVSLIVLLNVFGSCYASHETMSENQPSLGFTLLQSLGHTHNPPPGNGCSETGNGGNHCKPPINEKAFAGKSWAASMIASPSSSSFLVWDHKLNNNRWCINSQVNASYYYIWCLFILINYLIV